MKDRTTGRQDDGTTGRRDAESRAIGNRQSAVGENPKSEIPNPKFETRTPKIAPSILLADFGHMADAVKAVTAAGADLVHFDVMDGHFVPNLTFGAPMVAALRPHSPLPFDVHLMIERPWDSLEDFVEAGANHITVHVEACPHLHRVVQQIKGLGVGAGVALNPHTPLEMVYSILPAVDLLLIMTVDPGFGGQAFIELILPKIERAAQWVQNYAPHIWLEVDGGITPETAPRVVAAGAQVLVAGSSVFQAATVADGIAALRQAVQRVRMV